ncbi:MAG: helix-turn-helix domain-containing protein [Sulfuritalea sp.]|nr:helix-turn-helix domain-containing protein [Sulfuritalea sp.]
MGALETISTDQVRPRERAAFWTELLWTRLGKLRSETFSDETFRGRMVHGEVGSVKMCRLSAGRHRVVRSPDLIRQDGRGYLKLVVQLEGSTWFEQNGRKTQVSPGEWSIYDTMKAYSVSNTSPIEQLVLLVPREKVLTGSMKVDDLMVQRYSARAGIGRLACDLMSSAFDEIPGSTPQSAEAVGDAITELLRHSLLERSGMPTALSQREGMRDRIKAYVESNLRDPGLSIDQIAHAFRCSKRYLHKAFTQDGVTISDHIWRLRLERCRNDLLSPACAWKSITEIAFSWGFNSSTHFSKAFKDTFGMPPRFYRMAGNRSDATLPFPALRIADADLISPAGGAILRTLKSPAES